MGQEKDEFKIFVEENSQKIIQDLKRDLPELFEQDLDSIYRLATTWATALWHLQSKDESQKELAREMLKSVNNSIDILITDLKTKGTNYMWNKIENLLRKAFIEYLLPALLRKI